MASHHTSNFHLCQWETTDKVERLDFNADNAALEQALSDHHARLTEGNHRIEVVRSDLTGAVNNLRADMESEVDRARSEANSKVASAQSALTSKISSTKSTLEGKIAAVQNNLNTTNTNVAKCFSPDNLPFTVGSYVGNSAEENDSTVIQTENAQIIDLGFTPSFVMVYCPYHANRTSWETYNLGMATQAVPMVSIYGNIELNHLSIVTNGFKVCAPWYKEDKKYPDLNANGKTFFYIAMR